MNHKIILIAAMLPGILLVFFIGIFIPSLSRENILLGVNVPQSFKKSNEAKRFIRLYQRDFLLTVCLPTLLYIYLFFYGTFLVLMKYTIIYVFIIIFAMALNHYIGFKRVLKVKNKSNWTENKKQIIVAELKKGNEITNYPPRYLFLIPLSIIALTLLITWIKYPYLPEKIPMHYNINFEVDRWITKSNLFSELLPLYTIQVGITALLYAVYELIKWPKMKLSISDPSKSLQINNLVKRHTAILLIVILTVSQIMFAFTYLSILMIINVKILLWLNITLSIITTVIIFYYIYKFAELNNKRVDVQDDGDEKIIDREDDKYWIGGMFYYNPADPALFVEKRFGLGWDINYAKPLGKLMAFFIVAVILGAILLVIFLP